MDSAFTKLTSVNKDAEGLLKSLNNGKITSKKNAEQKFAEIKTNQTVLCGDLYKLSNSLRYLSKGTDVVEDTMEQIHVKIQTIDFESEEEEEEANEEEGAAEEEAAASKKLVGDVEGEPKSNQRIVDPPKCFEHLIGKNGHPAFFHTKLGHIAADDLHFAFDCMTDESLDQLDMIENETGNWKIMFSYEGEVEAYNCAYIELSNGSRRRKRFS